MPNIFEVEDKTGKKVILTRERWAHIRRDHPEVEQEDIEKTLQKPLKILEVNERKFYYFLYFKHKKFPNKYLRAKLNIKMRIGS